MGTETIKVEGLSKAYRIGLRENKYQNLGDAIVSFIKSPVTRFRKLRSLSSFDFSKEDESTFWALRDLSFNVNEGEAIGVIGKNGAGKSTLLKLLAKITDPTQGIITIRGRVAALLEVGTGFNPELTGRQNIYLNGTILGMTKKEIDKQFDEIVDFSGVEKFVDTPVKRYSSGMKVRLGFAVAAHLDPEILIVDEVLAVGDTEFQRKCIGKMQDVSQHRGKTIIFVSHDMSAVSKLTQKCLLLEHGKLRRFGPTEHVILDYNDINDESFQQRQDLSSIRRRGDFEIQLDNFWLNGRLNTNISIEPGEQLEMTFELNKKIVDSARLVIYITFYNSLNTPVFTVSNFYDNDYLNNDYSGQLITCLIPTMDLAPDVYSVMWYVKFNGGFTEHIDDLFRVHIKEADFFQTGNLPAFRKQGSVLQTSSWKLTDK